MERDHQMPDRLQFYNASRPSLPRADQSPASILFEADVLAHFKLQCEMKKSLADYYGHRSMNSRFPTSSAV
jgi:hypothetical protein